VIDPSGANNAMRVVAAQNGSQFNGTIEIVGGGTFGSETAVWNQGTQTLTVTIADGTSTAGEVATAINSEGTFTANIDDFDALLSIQAGTGAIDLGGAPSLTFTTAGGGGTVLDTASGFILSNGDESVALDITSAVTVEDLFNRIHGADLGLVAEINAAANGINVRSKLSGADFTIGENGGQTATQLGIRTYTLDTELAAFNRGVGVPTNIIPTNDDVIITARDGTQITVNLSTAQTVNDVISLINGDSDNGGRVTAGLATTGNGIELIDNTGAVGNLVVAAVEGSQAAQFLGFVPDGQTQVSSATGVLQSDDRHTLETESVFNTLLRLRTALETNDTEEIGRSLERLDVDLERVSFAQADIGNRLQNLDVIEVRLEDENVQLQAALAEDIDVDLVEAISQLTARQYAFEASLRSAASLMQLSLLNFL
jgi:flagellar hook-associated protein 3 FlgL